MIKASVRSLIISLILLLSSKMLHGFIQKQSRVVSRLLSTLRYSGPLTGRQGTRKALRMNQQDVVDPVRVRFAPSPTGSLHIGGARTALFNWLVARKTGGSFIVRVEDTDEARSTSASEKSILGDLRWLNLHWDEGPGTEGSPYGPYRQSERGAIYKQWATHLMERGLAYPCFCTTEELEEQRKTAERLGRDPTYDGTWRDADPVLVKSKVAAGDPYTVRFKVPKGKVVSITDMVRGKATWEAEACIGDFIILRSTGVPV